MVSKVASYLKKKKISILNSRPAVPYRRFPSSVKLSLSHWWVRDEYVGAWGEVNSGRHKGDFRNRMSGSFNPVSEGARQMTQGLWAAFSGGFATRLRHRGRGVESLGPRREAHQRGPTAVISLSLMEFCRATEDGGSCCTSAGKEPFEYTKILATPANIWTTNLLSQNKNKASTQTNSKLNALWILLSHIFPQTPCQGRHTKTQQEFKCSTSIRKTIQPSKNLSDII